MSGFIAVHRAAIDHPLFERDPSRLGAWVWMISRACWKETRHNIRGAVVTLQRGQFCASRSQIAQALKWSESAVERFLTRLQTEHMIERSSGHGRSIITICNYAKYQDFSEHAGQPNGQEDGHKSDSHRTAKEQDNHGTINLEPKGSCASGDAPSLKAGHVMEEWNSVADRIGKPKVRDLTPARKQLLNARISQYAIDDFVSVFSKIESSPFLRGDKDWKGCNFDWAMKRQNFQKILEGNYDR